MENEIKTKKCSKCGEIKTFDEFGKRGADRNYKPRPECKTCTNRLKREKRAKLNPKEIIPYGKKKCEHCREIKLFCEFHKSSIRKSGYSPFCKECKKKYAENNIEKDFKRKHNWYLKNKNLTVKRAIDWNKNNNEKRKEITINHYNKNKIINPQIYAWRSLLTHSLKRLGQKKEGHTIDLLGYSAIDLKNHIEMLFTDGMSWNNYGEWHIDHIKRLVEFDKNTHPNIVNALCNLRPLWGTTREINGVIYEGNLNRNKYD